MIIICEPQCMGFEHAEVNASLLETIIIAFPGKRVLFIGDGEHIKLISKILKTNFGGRIQYKPVNIFSRKASFFVKFKKEIIFHKRIFNIAINNKTDRIIFSSTTGLGLVAIKILQQYYNKIKCIVIPHAILAYISKSKQKFSCFEKFRLFRSIFTLGNTNRIHYLVLGEFIKSNLILELPKMEKYISSINTPYRYKKANDDNNIFLNRKSIQFGFLGVAHSKKGFDLFVKIAKELGETRTKYKPEFILIGKIVDEERKKYNYINNYIKVTSKNNNYLKYEEYNASVSNIDYAVFPYKNDAYRLRTSAAFFDALSFAKPIIVLQNPLFEYYFSFLGDIGYLCSSYKEMKRVIINIITKKPIKQYMYQRKNIINGRQKLMIVEIAKNLRKISQEINF